MNLHAYVHDGIIQNSQRCGNHPNVHHPVRGGTKCVHKTYVTVNRNKVFIHGSTCVNPNMLYSVKETGQEMHLFYDSVYMTCPEEAKLSR